MNLFRNFCRGIAISILLIVATSELRAGGRELINLIPESRVVIDFPDPGNVIGGAPWMLIIYALPNGNTIEHTAGRKIKPGDDWHYDIQHISAQTEFIRHYSKRYNYVVAYLESGTRAWTSYAAKHQDSPELFVSLVDTLISITRKEISGAVKGRDLSIALCSHSGGGRFVFNYIAGSVARYGLIPKPVRIISFIDSNYGFEDSLHTKPLVNWLRQPGERRLTVISYIDSTVVLNGKHIVSPTGGTGYRSMLMKESLEREGFHFSSHIDTTFKRYRSYAPLKGARGSSIEILIKENPNGNIYHTVLVEKNGFIESIIPRSRAPFVFWGDRAYSGFINDKFEISPF